MKEWFSPDWYCTVIQVGSTAHMSFAWVYVCFSLCAWFLFRARDPVECLFLPDAFVKQTNNRSLSFSPPLCGEDEEEEEEGTKSHPAFARSAKNHSAGIQSNFFLGNLAPWIAGQEGHFRSKAGNVGEMLQDSWYTVKPEESDLAFFFNLNCSLLNFSWLAYNFWSLKNKLTPLYSGKALHQIPGDNKSLLFCSW